MKTSIKLLLASFFIILSCNSRGEESNGEDYETLFPFQGVDAPDITYEDMISKQCNPSVALENYRYPGVNIRENVRDYTVTLKCVFYEYDFTGELEENATSAYTIRYINENKELTTVATNTRTANSSAVLENGIEKTFTFKVKSGYPMYLSLNGRGPRFSSVKTSISAISDDGVIESPTLETSFNQNQEGPNAVQPPYCQYIILP